MRIEDAALAVWFAAFVTIVTLCFIIFLSLVDAATLTISGNMMGQGVWNTTISGDIIMANITNSSWEIVAG